MTAPFLLTKFLARTGLARWVPGVARRFGADGAAALRHLSDRALATPLDELLAWQPYSEPAGEGIIDLSLAAPRLDLIPSGSTKLPADRRDSPPLAGLPRLRNRVADRLTHRRSHPVEPGEVLVTHGATGAFHQACDTFVNPGDRVVLFDPCSPLFPLTLGRCRADVRWVPTWSEGGTLRMAVERFERAMQNAKLVVLAQPNSPTGAAFATEELERVAWWAAKRGALVYCDETFEPFAKAVPGLGQVPAARCRLIVAGSVGVPFGLPAARVGWVAAQTPLLNPMLATQALGQPFVPTVAQQVALAALEQPDVVLDDLRYDVAEKRRYACERLRAAGLAVGDPGAGLFLWFDAPAGLTGRQFADALLAGQGVRVTPGEFFGPSGRGMVRLSVAGDDGRLRAGLAMIAEHVAADEVVTAEPVAV